jgi:hypothetical protein
MAPANGGAGFEVWPNYREHSKLTAVAIVAIHRCEHCWRIKDRDLCAAGICCGDMSASFNLGEDPCSFNDKRARGLRTTWREFDRAGQSLNQAVGHV